MAGSSRHSSVVQGRFSSFDADGHLDAAFNEMIFVR